MPDRITAAHSPNPHLAPLTVRGAGGVARILPDGCQDLIWVDGQLLVAGPDTRPHLVPDPPGASYLGLRFGPGIGPAVFGVPAGELRDRRLPLEALWPGAEVRRLADRLAATSDPAAVLESIAADRLDRAGPLDSVVREIVARLRAGEPVSAVAGALGLSRHPVRDGGRDRRLRRPGPPRPGGEGAGRRPARGAYELARAANRSTVLPSGSRTLAYRMPQNASHGLRCPA
jgi:hypothetical protein